MTEIWIPPLFDYEKDRDEWSISFLLGLLGYSSTRAAWRLRLLWFFTFAGGDADILQEVSQ